MSILILLSVALSSSLVAGSVPVVSTKITRNYSAKLTDGWYSAIVKYENYSTGTFATYTLDVKVEYNRVVKIDFGNGGSIHSGYNDDGYIYSGGDLYFEKDFEGNINAATATVTTSDNSGSKYYKVRIE